MTLAIVLAFLDKLTSLVQVLVASQTPEQSKILWDRYIERTEPLYKLLVKLGEKFEG